MTKYPFGEREKKFLAYAVSLSAKGMNSGAGGPFGSIVVKGDEIIGEGYNEVLLTNDPTAHAEVVAIRKACQHLGSFQLTGCEIYTSCEPCPMCMGAIYWARPERVYFANKKEDAAAIQFDDSFIYRELNVPLADRKIPFIACPSKEALRVFGDWMQKEDRKLY